MSIAALLGRLGRFGLVGVTSAFLYAAGVSVVVGVAGEAPLTGNIVGFLLAAACSYLGHHYITWAAGGDHQRYLPRFLAQAIATYLLSAGITWAVARLGWHYLIGVVLVIGLIPALNFLVLQFWVFTSRGDARPRA